MLLRALVSRVAEKMKDSPFGDGPEYDIYPTNLEEPFVSRRAEVAREMYELIGIERDDSAGRMKQMGRNFSFFDAPSWHDPDHQEDDGPPSIR